MQIETKFNVGDIVYVCKNNSTKDLETCKICDGKGVITVKDESFCCPKCHGGKFTYTKKVKKFVPEKRIIKKVIVSVTENNGNTQIYEKYDCETPSGKNRSVALYRNIMFASMKEAEARCKELMEELKDGFLQVGEAEKEIFNKSKTSSGFGKQILLFAS